MMTPSIALPAGLSMRPARDADKIFLSALYRSTRADLRLLNGETELVESLLDMQTRARNDGYGTQFPNALDFIIELHGEAMGRATVDFGHNEVRLVDMAFIPTARGKGYGKAVLQSLQMAAAKVHTPLTLSALVTNAPALALFAALGFRVEQQSGSHLFLAWYPGQGHASRAG